MLCELQHSVQRLVDLIQQVMNTSGQEKIDEAQQLVDKLEKEISQLRKKDSDLKEIVTCQDNIYFLKVHTKTGDNFFFKSDIRRWLLNLFHIWSLVLFLIH